MKADGKASSQNAPATGTTGISTAHLLRYRQALALWQQADRAPRASWSRRMLLKQARARTQSLLG